MCGAQRAAAPAPHPPTPHPATARNRINKTRRAGYEVLIVPGPETSAAQRAGFLAAYEQTMRRAAAAEHYFFAAADLDRILESDLTCPARSPHPRPRGSARGELRRLANNNRRRRLDRAPRRGGPAAHPRRRHRPRRRP